MRKRYSKNRFKQNSTYVTYVIKTKLSFSICKGKKVCNSQVHTTKYLSALFLQKQVHNKNSICKYNATPFTA